VEKKRGIERICRRQLQLINFFYNSKYHSFSKDSKMLQLEWSDSIYRKPKKSLCIVCYLKVLR
jgi:hypothetical protein